jgi:DNA polymerase III delta prime subunit
MDFKTWFCLNKRESFTIDPKINEKDAQFYFGRQQLAERMRKQIQRAFVDPQVPKMMVWGPYGCGKTQTLYHLAYELQHKKPASCRGTPYPVHLDIEMQSKSTARSWHLQNMEALGMQVVQEWLQKLFDKSSNFDAEVAKLTTDPNIVRAFSNLRGSGELSFAAWRWLSGQSLTAKELQEIKVTRSLGEVGVGGDVSVFTSELELPTEPLRAVQLPDGKQVIRSDLGFTHTVRNQTESNFLLYAQLRGHTRVSVPKKMLDVFRAVKAYENYLRELRRSLLTAYERKSGHRPIAEHRAREVFRLLGLPWISES